jgi:hypothetical protein
MGEHCDIRSVPSGKDEPKTENLRSFNWPGKSWLKRVMRVGVGWHAKLQGSCPR